MRDSILNLSPLDGRYEKNADELRPYFSESALMRYRIQVEIEWYIFLCNNLKLEGTRSLKSNEQLLLRKIYEDFSEKDANSIKNIENTTNHDVKAIEYFIKEKTAKLKILTEFIHFACTSEDINNLAYALMAKAGLQQIIIPNTKSMLEQIFANVKKYRTIPMMARTHGQPATPTTVGKEFLNVLARLERQFLQLQKTEFFGKINGAVGNFNAHAIAYPKTNWQTASKKFIQSLGLTPQLYTTQIEPHDYLAELFDNLKRFNTILIDFNRDIWGYISLNYFKQKLKDGEVGSSTMPHKVNPIDFENSEGNLGLANTLFTYFSEKLPISRFQRDLTDSTTLRNIGTAFGYSLIAYKSFNKGLSKLEINENVIANDLNQNWELLAEPIQTVMRKFALPKPYEQLKTLTRGKKIDQNTIHQFIDKLEIPADDKKRLKSLTPSKYIGLAVEIIDAYQPTFTKKL